MWLPEEIAKVALPVMLSPSLPKRYGIDSPARQRGALRYASARGVVYAALAARSVDPTRESAPAHFRHDSGWRVRL